MKKRFGLIILFLALITFEATAQEVANPISTAAPFLTITPDARGAAMGNVGATTSPDVFSQFYNPAKYAFSESNSGIGISYTPWLGELVDDIFVGYVSGYYKINNRSAFSSSLRYFSLGEINLTDGNGDFQGTMKPNEFSLDLAYSMLLSDSYSMSVGARYIQSSIVSGGFNGNDDTEVGKSVGVDISGFYMPEYKSYSSFDGRLTIGWSISNLGLKMSYNKNATEDQKYFLPTNLRFGTGYSMKFDNYNTLNLSIEANKLLVPTPPITDASGNILEGKDPNVSVIKGAVQSFYDAPGGFSEEFKEIAWAMGAEYVYDETFALRTGYFHENELKGDRQYATIGFGFMYSSIGLDFSYLINTSSVRSPLENTMRFSLIIDFDSFNMFAQDE
jgi:hypothetical protein